MRRISCVLCSLAGLLVLTVPVMSSPTLSLPHTLPPLLSADPPAAPVKLIFIHHSTGGNWLADPNNDQPYGGLGRALMENNYFVSATNYGWGPDGIGDRTDIPNWLEWFVGPNRDVYLDALYNENGQNVGDFGNWSRMASDPGGENVIIMFKSCFPNSDLYGDPDDPPLSEPNDYDYTVANAKAVYNALLTYFETRQDKLFVVITAPPLMRGDTSRGRADNARAFNDWLVDDWLADYPYANVAVFDYFNVLTDPDNHHYWMNGDIVHIQASDNNFSAYPSGDSHPSTEGHSKATTEFVPLLNVAYNRWQAGGAVVPPPVEPTTAPPQEATETPPEETTEAPPETVAAPATGGSVIDDFEGDLEWYADLGEGTTLTCNADSDAHSGAAALQAAYTIPADSWGGCGRYYDVPQDWSDGNGLSFWLRTDAQDQWVTLILYSGPIDAPTPFECSFEVPTNWNAITIPWSDLTHASWADETGLAEIDPARITSIAFSFGEGQGNLWVDDISRSSGETPPPEPPVPEQPTEAPTVEEQPSTPPAEPTEEPRGGLCASAPLALVLLVAGFVRERPLRKSK
jgi:hypothetical protein